ncbi:ethanolamine ammonia-lyase reactivating factor EutA [Shigella flexneri]|nr:ethanolamine ammonia-lyase reactivating factor EutA [Shigella flexneri]
MKRIAFVGSVGAGKTTLFNALQGNYTLARKTLAVEFNDKGDIDTPGEYFSHPRWYHALITTLQDVDMLIYVHGANDPESRLPAGLLDIGVSKRQIAVISKTDMPDADVAATRKLLLETGFEEPIFELNSHDPQSVQQLVDYLASLTKQEEAGEKLITANDIREAHARGEQAMSVVLRASIITPEAREVADLLGFTITECDESIPVTASVPASVPADKTESQRIRETIIAQLPEGQFTESLVAQLMEKVMKEKQSLGDFVVASAGPHLESVIAGHGAGAQTLSEQRLCRVLNIDIGGGTANYALFDAGKISGTACLNVGGRLLETDSQGRVVYAHKPGQMIVDECFGAGTDARSLTGAQLVQVTRRMAALIVEVIDGTLSPLAQALMQTGLLPAGVTPEIITLSGGVGECYRHQPANPFCFADIGPLLATALHDHPRLREMNVQFPAQTVRSTVIGAGAHTLSLSGSTIWLEGVQLPLRNLPVAIPIDETDLVSAWQQALLQLDLDPKTDVYVLALPASLPVRYAAVLTVINALVDFVARFPNPHPLLVVAGQDFGKALGMLLRPQLQQLPLAVIDEVIVRAGDYIDIGTPLFGGSVVPVTVKSLAFPS